MSTCAAVMGPTPRWFNRWGARASTSSEIDSLRSSVSVVSARMRLARLRSACLVAVSSLIGAVSREPCAFGDLGGGGETSELVTKIDRRGD